MSSSMRCIVRRYIGAEQKKAEEFAITEDDVSEIRQDINKFRYEMINILRHNNFETPNVDSASFHAGGKRAKQMERRIMKVIKLYYFHKPFLLAFDDIKKYKVKEDVAPMMQLLFYRK